jgi:DNA-binding beta-propeller fold protein YncE
VTRRTRLAAFALTIAVVAVAASIVAWLTWRPAPPPLTAGAWMPVVTTIAGRGVGGVRDGAWDVAELSDPFAVAVAPDGRLYVADAGDSNRIRQIDTAGRVSTLAGGAGEGSRDGAGRAAAFHTPSGLALATDGSLYVADTGANRIRRVAADGIVTTVAGTGERGSADGSARAARFDGPMGLALAPDGTLYIADAYNDRIRALDRNGLVRTVAGAGTRGFADGDARTASFDTPCGIAVAPDGTVVVADTGNNAIRRIGRNGAVTTVVPSLYAATEDVSLVRPIGIAVDRAGSTYVTDARGRILQVLADGRARILAGSVTGFTDGAGRLARLANPTGIALDRDGALVVADAGNYMVRRIAPPGLYAADPPRSPIAPPPGFTATPLRALTMAWPVDDQFAWHEVAGTMGEARGSMGDARERFHAGIDVWAPEGVVVRAVHSAKVDRPIAATGFGSLTENVSIGPFTYIHIRVGRTRRDEVLSFDGTALDHDLDASAAAFTLLRDAAGAPDGIRLRRGTRVALGDAIGTVNRFSHVHLNVGRSGLEINPLSLPLAEWSDTVRPTIERRGVRFYDEYWAPLDRVVNGRVVLSGRVRIVVDAYDQMDGNSRRRRLGIYRAGYRVLASDGTVEAQPGDTILLDQLPEGAAAAHLVYAEGSGIPVYGARRTRFRYIVTNRVAGGEAAEDFWDTARLAPGPHVVEVYVGDASGNVTTTTVRVMLTPLGPSSF